MIYYDLPMAEYRQNPALGSTDLKNILKTPAKFRHARLNPMEESEAMKLGTAVHTYLLERPTFFDVYAVEPEGLINKAVNPWKSDWDKFKAANKDKKILKRDYWIACKGIYDVLTRHKWASQLYDVSSYEVSVIGDQIKGRADMLCDSFITDIKTCENAENFIYSVQDHQYYLQAALYIDLFKSADGLERQFVWIACEKAAPYDMKVCVATDEMIELGRKEYKAALEIYQRCVETNDWPGYDEDIEDLHFTPWFKGVLG